MTVGEPWRFRAPRRTPAAGRGSAADPSSTAEPAIEEDLTIVCAVCERAITSPRLATAVKGAHEHTFRNPQGVDFRIGCFTEAPGCSAAGEISSVWTWFPGMTWQPEICAACGEHLGWIYRRPASLDPAFHGLILDRLRELAR
jgi:hypothetical protein